MARRSTAPKIFRRGNRFYVRIQVPKELQVEEGRKEFWISLGTEDHEEAIANALDVAKEKHNYFALQARRRSGHRKTIKSLSSERQLDLAREAFALHLRDLSKTRDELQAIDQPDWEEYVRIQEQALFQIEGEIAQLGARHDFVESLTEDILGHNLLTLDPGSEDFITLGRMVAEAALNAQRTFVGRLRGHHIPDNPDPRFIDSNTGEPRKYTPVRVQDDDASPSQKSLVVLTKRFVDSAHIKRSPKTKSAMHGYLRVVSDILGPSKDVRTITHADCLMVVDLIRRLPANFEKLPKLKRLSIEQKADKAEKLGLSVLSPGGVNNYIRYLYSFLRWCEGSQIITSVPMKWELVRVDDPVAKEDKRLPFHTTQLQTLFNSKVYEADQRSSAMFWVPLIALWNGMRANEICQLDAADVRVEDGCSVFDISHLGDAGDNDKRTKNRSSVRVVPIHPRLIDFGFLDFRATRGKREKLFADITRGRDGYYSSTFSKKANRYFDQIGIRGEKHKFHSLRHNFRDAMRRGKIDPGIARALGGWTGTKTEAFEIYGEGYPVSQLAEAIRKIEYPGLDLRHLEKP